MGTKLSFPAYRELEKLHRSCHGPGFGQALVPELFCSLGRQKRATVAFKCHIWNGFDFIVGEGLEGCYYGEPKFYSSLSCDGEKHLRSF